MFGIIKKIAHSDFIENITRDMKSLRVLFVYMTWLLFVYVVLYSLTHYPNSANTTITIVGGVVSVVFTNYVFSKTTDKKIDAMKDNGKYEHKGGE